MRMKKMVAALAIAAAMTAGPVFADTMENAYGNTVVVRYPDGNALRYHFNADHTFSATLPDGSTMQGTYEVAGDQICLTPAGGQQACTGYVGDKSVGDTWTQTATDGSSISVSIEAGR
jgi:hypothetical protein